MNKKYISKHAHHVVDERHKKEKLCHIFRLLNLYKLHISVKKIPEINIKTGSTSSFFPVESCCGFLVHVNFRER